MTHLVNELLTDALKGSNGWQIAQNTSVVQEQPEQFDPPAHAV